MKKPTPASFIDNEAFLYERLRTRPGIKLEIVSGGAGYGQKAREMLARQVWCENAREGYRGFDHTEEGVPLLFGDTPEMELQRVSVSHTKGLYAVATLPPAPEGTDLEKFSPITALGVDVEASDRVKVLDVRSRFLNEEELSLVPDNDVQANIIAWTCKEAMLKLSLTPGIDIRKGLTLSSLPVLNEKEGKGKVLFQNGTEIDVLLYSLSLLNGKYIITLAYTPSTLRFGNVSPS